MRENAGVTGKKTFLGEIVKNRTLYMMFLPTLVYFVVFSYLPMAGLYLAFTRYNFNGGIFGSPFVGFKNFEFLFSSGTAYTITANTVLYNLAFIVVTNSLQVFVAIVLSELPGKIFKKASQSVLFLPYFISYVILSVFIYNLFNYEHGFVNSTLKTIGIKPIDVYNNPAPWKFIILFFYIWKNLGYGSVIYFASIMNISQDYYEASEIDGANVLQQIRHITIPSIMPTFVLLFLFSLGTILRGQFELFYQLIGDNGVLYDATDIIDTYVYRSLQRNFDYGLGTAAGLYQSFFGLILIVTVNTLVKRRHPEYALF
jgi:putative aldouronate transport system permease protein